MTTLAGASGLLGQGISPRVLLVHLEPDSDVEAQYDWLEHNRPDLVPRLGYIAGPELPFYEDVGVRRYREAPDAETLVHDWGEPSHDDDDGEAGDDPTP